MRTIRILRHGLTLSTVPRNPPDVRGGLRGAVTCWSPGAARRNVAFLRSVKEQELKGVGVAFTLTLGTCPPTREAWAKLLDTWIKRQRRGGCSVLHWVTEFQRRGVPHLHVAAWYAPDALRPATVEKHRQALGAYHGAKEATHDHQRAAVVGLVDWLEVAAAFVPGARGQHARPIVGAVGWFQYLAKHCGRGRGHYQRQQASFPRAWSSAPRAWGKSGDWPLQEPADVALGSRGFYRLRRLMRSQRVARARRAVPGPGWAWHQTYAPLFTRQQTRDLPIHPTRIVGGSGPPLRVKLRNLKHARQMLRCPLPELSAVRGVSEWVDIQGQADLLRAIGVSADELAAALAARVSPATGTGASGEAAAVRHRRGAARLTPAR